MTKKDLSDEVALEMCMPKQLCENIIDEFIDKIKDCLSQGKRVYIKGFMTFQVSERKERGGRDPKSGEIVKFPSVKVVKCKPSQFLRECINGKESKI